MTPGEREHRYAVQVIWTGDRGEGTRSYRGYGREHTIEIAGKPPLAASSDPAFCGDATRHNPEDLLVAALSSCHMLWYLHLCADAGVVVTGYVDQAEGVMIEAGAAGGCFDHATLRPIVTVAAGSDPQLALDLHERAHAMCYIASSVNFPVHCEAKILRADLRV